MQIIDALLLSFKLQLKPAILNARGNKKYIDIAK